MSKNKLIDEMNKQDLLKIAAATWRIQSDSITKIEEYNVLKQICNDMGIKHGELIEAINSEYEGERQFNKMNLKY
jgi:hypothetical protein